MVAHHRARCQFRRPQDLSALRLCRAVHRPGKAARVKASLTLVEARRLALAAQLSPGARRQPTPAAAAIGKLVDHLGLLQIDSVNVLSRSHYLPVFSRLGAYDQAILDHLTYSREKRRFFEYWAHEASFLPFSLFPLLRWRMDDA